jgi:hypothetical protein
MMAKGIGNQESFTSPSATLHAQARRAADRFIAAREIWDRADRRLIRHADVFHWRNRFAFMEAASAAFLSIEKCIDDDIGPTITEWKRSSKSASVIIRRLVNLEGATRDSFTSADVESALPRGFATRRLITSILSRGIQLGLLKKNEQHEYRCTEMFYSEFYARTLRRDLDKDIVKYARMVVAFADMIDIANETLSRETVGAIHDSGARTMSERIDDGDYDAEINYQR